MPYMYMSKKKRVQKQKDVVLEHLKTREFPGLTRRILPGVVRLATCFDFIKGSGIVTIRKDKGGTFNDLAEWAEWKVRNRTPFSYQGIEYFLQSHGVRFIPEYVFPITDINIAGALGLVSPLIRVDWYLPEYGIVIECDYDTNHRKSIDYVRDQYLRFEYGIIDIIRITCPSEVASVLEQRLTLYRYHYGMQEYPVFSKNSEMLWLDNYREQVEFANIYYNLFGRLPTGPDVNIDGCFKISLSELSLVAGGKSYDLASNTSFMEKLRDFYQEFYHIPIKIVNNLNTCLPKFRVIL